MQTAVDSNAWASRAEGKWSGGDRQREVKLAFHDYWIASTESNGTNADETIDSAIADCDRRQRWDRPRASGAPYVNGLYEIDDQDGRRTVDIPGRWREPIRAATGDAGHDTVVVQVTRRPDGTVLSIAVAPLRDRVCIERTETGVVVHAGSQRLTVSAGAGWSAPKVQQPRTTESCLRYASATARPSRWRSARIGSRRGEWDRTPYGSTK